jgi:hypothetical protein
MHNCTRQKIDSDEIQTDISLVKAKTVPGRQHRQGGSRISGCQLCLHRLPCLNKLSKRQMIFIFLFIHVHKGNGRPPMAIWWRRQLVRFLGGDDIVHFRLHGS